MSFASVIDLMVGNLNIALENIVLIVWLMAGFLFYAKEFRLGILVHFLGFGCIFVVFALLGLNTLFALLATLCGFVLLTLSLYISFSKQQRSGLV